jgi:hypothetical protein
MTKLIITWQKHVQNVYDTLYLLKKNPSWLVTFEFTFAV